MVGVYIPPQANATTAIGALADQITTVDNSNPDSLVLILGDFNHTTLSKELPKYKRQVTCATREGETLDLCYSTIREAYHAVPRAPLGFSDHAMLYLLPSYRQKLKRVKPCVRNIKHWDDESILRLQGCLACTDWDSFRFASNDIHEYADTVTSYIDVCQDLCIPQKSVKVFGNDKPWFTKNQKNKLKQKEEAFKIGDRALYKKAKYGVEKAITDIRRKLEGQFLSNDTRSVWQGLQCITGYKQKHSIPGFESATPDNFNHFYARFDRQNLTPTSVSLPDPAVSLPPPFTFQEHEVRKLLKQQSSRKAAGPDNVSTSTLK